TKVPDFKDSGSLKPQAARFRVWEYVENKGKYEPSREMNLDEKDCLGLSWTVHLANRKASFFKFRNLAGEERAHPAGDRRNPSVTDRRKLEIDPLPRSISGRGAKKVEFVKGNSSNPAKELWPNPAPTPPIDYLGELRTDGAGRLIVLGGIGRSASVSGKALGPDVFNNDGWFDDVSDGPVTATLTLAGPRGKKRVVTAEGAWFICGPPDFAPSIRNMVSLYDVLFDVAAREMKLPRDEALFDKALKPLAQINAEFKAAGAAKLSTYKPSFDDEIFPILRCAQEQIFVFEPLKAAHATLGLYAQLGDPGAAAQSTRQSIFSFVHPPGLAGPGGSKNMPKLHGDEYSDPAHKRNALTLTETQYALLEQWARGNFVKTAGTLPPPLPPAAITPNGLDQAALENCVGGAFCPGIEVGWQIRNKKLFAAPFRIDHAATSQYLGEVGQIRAGHFSRQMALPWQTDFLACRLQGSRGWWPAQRPDIVYQSKSDFDATPRKSQPWHRASSGGAPANWPSGGAAPSGQEFIDNFHKLGVVREDPRFYHVEKERDPNVP
ncbi:MAG: LodA/GoxA family CTQ-dependent oxidase, partial [Acidobacteriota bacterium]|nr:LodA/GoxA family CTQ-dependent oxidase [Acidobacteriota bacterium]